MTRVIAAALLLLTVTAGPARAQGKGRASRADLRFGTGPDNQVFLLNKRDGTVRLLAP